MPQRVKTLFALHLLIMVYSVSSVVSKFASAYDFLSLQFIGLYLLMLALLGLYALGWQQILRRMPLSSAYANRAVDVIWGIIWGLVFFAEPVTLPKLVGAAFIMAGVILFARADDDLAKNEADAGDGTVESGARHE